MVVADKPSLPAVGAHGYGVEPGPCPVSAGLAAAIADALAGAAQAPRAFVWNDVVPVFSRGFRWHYRCLRWPLGDALLAGQVTAAGRCAIASGTLEQLYRDGVIARPGDAGAALAALLASAPGSVVELGGVYRFTGSQRSPAYRPCAVPTPPASAKSLSIIVNYRDRPDLMEGCLASIAAQRFTAAAELILVDNQSVPDNRRRVDACCRVLPQVIAVRHLDYDAPFNKSVQDNMAAAHAAGDVLILMNNDARVLGPTVLQTLADWAMSPGVASAGPRFVGRGKRLVSSGVQTVAATGSRLATIRESEVEALSRTVHYTAGASFACAAVRRDVWSELGGCDAAGFRSQYNDADFDLRALARGYRHLYVGAMQVFHEPGGSEPRTRESLEPLRAELRRRHPAMASYRRLDPALEPLPRRPCFREAGPRGALALSRLYGTLRNGAAAFLGRGV